MPEQQSTPRYVSMPDGSYVEWPDNVSAQDFKAKVAGKFGQTQPQAQEDPKPGFLENLGSTFGITPEAIKQFKQHPISSTVDAGAMMPINALKAGYEGAKRSAGEVGEAYNAAKEHNPAGVGVHAIQAIPFIGAGLKKSVEELPAKPGEDYNLGDISPGMVGTSVGTAAQVAPLILGGAELANPGRGPFYPSKAHALKTFEEVGKAAKNTPVPLTETTPAIQNFRDYVATGGRGSSVMTKLGRRAEVPDSPMMFPEARDFYSNVSQATAKPGFLRRAVESPAMPKQRYNIGNVRAAMNEDLTNAAQSAGVGDKYAQAMKEFRNNARLRSALKVGGAAAAGEAIKRTGLPGKIVKGIAE